VQSMAGKRNGKGGLDWNVVHMETTLVCNLPNGMHPEDSRRHVQVDTLGRHAREYRQHLFIHSVSKGTQSSCPSDLVLVCRSSASWLIPKP